MEDNSESLYIELLYSIIENLKKNFKVKTYKIEYDNVELLIEESELNSEFTISFQKQNGSFTLITHTNLQMNQREMMINLLEDITKVDKFASYHFSDMQDINIDHFVYDENKLDFNRDILNQFRNMNQIINFTMNEVNKVPKK